MVQAAECMVIEPCTLLNQPDENVMQLTSTEHVPGPADKCLKGKAARLLIIWGVIHDKDCTEVDGKRESPSR